MHYVKPTPAVIGEAGHTPFDTERRTRLPVDKFRPVPGPTERWARLAREGSVTLVDAETLPAGQALPDKAVTLDNGLVTLPGDPRRYVREEDIEGYEPPPAAEPAADPAPAWRATTNPAE